MENSNEMTPEKRLLKAIVEINPGQAERDVQTIENIHATILEMPLLHRAINTANLANQSSEKGNALAVLEVMLTHPRIEINKKLQGRALLTYAIQYDKDKPKVDVINILLSRPNIKLSKEDNDISPLIEVVRLESVWSTSNEKLEVVKKHASFIKIKISVLMNKMIKGELP